MASLESSIPPSTHCSAATSCGGVRSKSPSLGAISVTLTRPLLPRPGNPGVNALLRTPISVLADGSDILLARRDRYQPTQWTALWITCADTPGRLCAPWG